MTTPRTLRLSDKDNVVVAIDQITAGTTANGIVARERVPRGHKMAIAAIAENAPMHKYGQIIGFASKPIAPGEWVHEHNVGMHDFARDYRFCRRCAERRNPAARAARDLRGLCASQRQDRHAQLHRRAHLGELLGLGRQIHRRGLQPIRPARRLSGSRRRRALRARHRLRHGRLWRGLRLLRRTQWGYATHPNLGGSADGRAWAARCSRSTA